MRTQRNWLPREQVATWIEEALHQGDTMEVLAYRAGISRRRLQVVRNGRGGRPRELYRWVTDSTADRIAVATGHHISELEAA